MVARNELSPGLSRERGEEKVFAHHGGDASKLVDIVRKVILFDKVENLYGALEGVQKEMVVVGVEDRIAKPTAMGYGDIRLNIRTTEGHICTMRLLLDPIVEAKAGAHGLYEDSLCILAADQRRANGSNHGGAVVAVDMFNYMDDDSVTLITGFPSASEAQEYARRRTRDSVEEMRTIDEADDDNLWWLWLVYGEDCIALGNGTDETWCGYSELESFLGSPASESERDWLTFGQQFDLRAEALVPNESK